MIPLPAFIDDVRLVVSHLAELWRVAGRKAVEYPVRTEDVLELLVACDFSVDLERVDALVRSGRVDVTLVDGRHRWPPKAVLQAIVCFEVQHSKDAS